MTSGIGHNGAGKDTGDGWFRVHRSIFDHAVVGINDRPFTEFEAWIWLFGYASYREREVINKGQLVILDPGQIMAAHGYLAAKWKWTVDKARWFLKRLETHAMIARYCTTQHAKRNTNQIQIITICNYALYQSGEMPNHQANHQPKSQANTKPTPSQRQANTKPTPTGEEVKKLRSKEHTSPDAYASGESVRACEKNSSTGFKSQSKDSEDGLHRDSVEAVQKLHQAAIALGEQIKGRAPLKTELDGSRGIELRDGKLTVMNGTLAELQQEFPGIDFSAVCNKAAKRLVDRSNPKFEAAMAAIREYAQYAIEEQKKPKPTYGRTATPARDLLAGLDPKYRSKIQPGGKSNA